MYDRTTEAFGLNRPLALNAAVALDALSRGAANAAQTLRASASGSADRSRCERPRDRLGPREQLLRAHDATSAWRLK